MQLSITKLINIRRAEILEKFILEWNCIFFLPRSSCPRVPFLLTPLFSCSHDAHHIHLQMERHKTYQPQVQFWRECNHNVSPVHWKYHENILILLTLFSPDCPTVWISVVLPVIFYGQQSFLCHVTAAELSSFCYVTTLELSQSRIGNLVSDEPGICLIKENYWHGF